MHSRTRPNQISANHRWSHRFRYTWPALKAPTVSLQTEVSASPTFFGWVFGFNGKVQILAPESVKEQYRQMIAQADEGMQQKENKEQEI